MADVFGFSHEQGPVGPRVPEGHSHHEDTQWDAGTISSEWEDERREELKRKNKISDFFFNNLLHFAASFRVRLPVTAVLTVAVKCGCATATDTSDR